MNLFLATGICRSLPCWICQEWLLLYLFRILEIQRMTKPRKLHLDTPMQLLTYNLRERERHASPCHSCNIEASLQPEETKHSSSNFAFILNVSMNVPNSAMLSRMGYNRPWKKWQQNHKIRQESDLLLQNLTRPKPAFSMKSRFLSLFFIQPSRELLVHVGHVKTPFPSLLDWFFHSENEVPIVWLINLARK